MSRSFDDFNQAYTDQPGPPVSPEPFVFLSIDYDEPDVTTYRGVIVSVSKGSGPAEDKRFAKPEQAEAYANKIGGRKSYSSSFDNFRADLKRQTPHER